MAATPFPCVSVLDMMMKFCTVRRMRSLIVRSWILVFVTHFALIASEDWPSSRGLVLEGDVVTMDDDRVIRGGRVCIRGETIVAVLAAGDALPTDFAAAPVVVTGGYIFPGLIDAHSHVEYNVLPLWPVSVPYQNRYQWTKPKAYKRDINLPKKLLTERIFCDLDVEVIKYAEAKALLGGVTSIQGSPHLAATAYAVRNIENTNFGQDRIYQHGLSIDDGRFQDDLQTGLLSKMADGQVDAFLIHLAEGIDAKSRAEFATLKRLGLLRSESVVIHGTALQGEDFAEMQAAGMKLVWSPLSNLLLYGQTTNIPAARSRGLLVCLGSDWSPSGSKNLLGEIKIAHEYDRAMWGGSLSLLDLARMVTCNPAFALGLDDKIGRVRTGLYADLMVVERSSVDPSDPYRALLNATERDVKLVLVGGVPYHGDRAIMERLKPNDFELITVGGSAKAIDLTDTRVVGGTTTLAQIRSVLDHALLLDHETLAHCFGDGRTEAEFDAYLNKTFPGLKPVTLDPLLPDAAFFAVIRSSPVARLTFDIETYWTTAAPPVSSDMLLLRLVNDRAVTISLLDIEAGINIRAANTIISYRNGQDGLSGTADDDLFDDLAEVDAVPFVGASTLNLLRTYAIAHPR